MRKRPKNHDAMVVYDTPFCQCDNCGVWLKLPEADETGYRTIPLIQHIDSKNNWLCDTCWDRLDEECLKSDHEHIFDEITRTWTIR